MKLGLFGIGSGLCADPDIARRVAQVAEHQGIESLWTGEHVVLPDPQRPPSPVPPEFPMLHPSAILSFLAACTDRIKLATGIVLIAQRNALVLAKEMASLDVLCDGRLILGIGAGYLEAEFSALGIPFEQRGARADESIEVMRAIWNETDPEYHGRFYSFSGIQAFPRPIQPGGPALVVGGTSTAALRRAVRSAQGWYGFALDVDQTAACVKQLKQLSDNLPASTRRAALEISITPVLPMTEANIADYQSAGVDRLIPLMPQDSEQHMLDFIENLVEISQRV